MVIHMWRTPDMFTTCRKSTRMAGRVLVAVLVVVAGVTGLLTPSVLSMEELKFPCRNDAGEQPPVDLENLQKEMTNCAMEELSADIQRANNNPQKIMEMVCSKKNQLLKCTDMWYATMERCFKENGKKTLLAYKNVNCIAGNYICDHSDDFLALILSPDQKCTLLLGERLQTCFLQQIGISNLNTGIMNEIVEKIEQFMGSMNQTCRTLAATQKCAITDATECKESSIFQFSESLLNKVVKDGICSKEGVKDNVCPNSATKVVKGGICSKEGVKDNVCPNSATAFMIQNPMFLIVNILALISFRSFLL